MSELSHTGRRVLGHLPVWAADEAAFVEAEGGPQKSIRGYSLRDFTARLDEDPYTPAMTPAQVQACLQELAGQGCCELVGETPAVPAVPAVPAQAATGPAPEQPEVPGKPEVPAIPPQWRMTQKGFEVLTDPTEPDGKSQALGPAFVELAPAVASVEGVS